MQETSSTNAEIERRDSEPRDRVAPPAGGPRTPTTPVLRPSAVRLRPVLFSLGVLCAVFGAAGMFLPLLPTTPLLLLAAACFARSSPRAHRVLLANRLLGPVVARWERERTVAPRAKATAVLLVVGCFAVSIGVLRDPVATVVLVSLGVALVVFLARLPTSRVGRTGGREHPHGL